MMNGPTQSVPHAIVLLGGESLRPSSSDLWTHIFNLGQGGTKSISIVYAGIDPQDPIQRERRLKTMAHAFAEMRVTANVLDTHEIDHPSLEEIIYLAGINPLSIADTFAGTTLWTAICKPETVLVVSGGASVAVGELAFAPVAPYPAALDELEFAVTVGLGLIPGIMILPYFGWLPDAVIQRIAELEPDLWMMGIDDQAAVILNHDRWQVAGLGTVTLFRKGEPARIYDPGTTLPLLPSHSAS